MSGSTTNLSVPDGVALPIDDLELAFEYDGAFVSSITVVYNENTYVQTITNDGTNITNISQWTLQV